MATSITPHSYTADGSKTPPPAGTLTSSYGHVRQAGGDSRLKLRRHGCDGAGVESHLRSVHSKGARSTAWRIVLRPQRHNQALRLRRTAARLRGLDSGTAVERWAFMPFDGAVDRVKLVRPRMGS